MPVRLPVLPDAELRLVVVKWPKGENPMMLLDYQRLKNMAALVVAVFCPDDDGLRFESPATAKTPENRARVRVGSVAIFKTGDNPAPFVKW